MQKFKGNVQVDGNLKLTSSTPNKAVITDASGNVSQSTTSDTELGYLTGVTSSVQTQINSKADDAVVIKKNGSVAFTGDQSLGNNKLTNLANGSASGDAVNKSQLDLMIPLTQKAANNGVATLDAGGKVPSSQLPNTVMEFQGTYNASTNTPTLADGVGNIGDVYVTTVAGTQDLGSGNITFAVGDWVIYNASGIWEKSINSNAVVSVNSQQGVVTVNAINELTGDVTAGPASGSQSKAATIAAGAVTPSKLGTVTDNSTLDQSGAGSTLQIKTGGILNTHVNTSAGIARSKLASGTADHVIINDGTGVMSSEAQLGLSRGGTGLNASSPANGSILIGNGTAFNLTTITAGSGVSVTNGSGTITIAAAPLSAGDINETSFSGANNQASPANVTGLLFANGVVRSFKAHVSVNVQAASNLYETFELVGIQKDSSWDLAVSSVGDDSSLVFSITNAGQIQYMSGNYGSFTSLTIKFRAITTSI